MKTKLLIYLILIAVLSGCGSSQPALLHSFIPQSHNVPAFTDKGQCRAEATVSIRSADLHLAYSPIKHLGIIANIQYANTTNFKLKNTDNRYNYTSPEIAIGAYTTINKRISCELYGGIAFINSSYNQSDKTDNQSDTTYHDYGIFVLEEYFTSFQQYGISVNREAYRYFIQPDIAFNVNNHFSFAFSCKAAYWNYTNYFVNYSSSHVSIYSNSNTPNNIKTTNTVDEQYTINYSNASQITLEPCFTVKAGSKNIKAMFQLGRYYTINNGYDDIHSYDVSNRMILRFGICAELNFGKNKI